MKHISINGSPFVIGRQLGEFSRCAWHLKVVQTALWQTVTAMQSSAQAKAMRKLVMKNYPLIWQELEGLAEGVEASIEEVFAWNCRGDLVPSTSDGCTTVAGINALGERFIAHNEDGFPQLRSECAWAEVIPDEGMSFSSFVYPGSICGHTFAMNEKGIVNTVNNIRAVLRPDGIPRQVLARASLNATTLDDAVDILTSHSRSGAFHHTLGQIGDERIFSIESTGFGSSVRQVKENMGHANHLTHPKLMDVRQVITSSSASRQLRLNEWLATQPHINASALTAILSDQCNAYLPLYRLSPEDPDEENTLATAVFTFSKDQLRWQILGLNRYEPEYQGIMNG